MCLTNTAYKVQYPVRLQMSCRQQDNMEDSMKGSKCSNATIAASNSNLQALCLQQANVLSLHHVLCPCELDLWPYLDAEPSYYQGRSVESCLVIP